MNADRLTIQLDHFIAPCRDQVAAARRPAELPGVTRAKTGAGPFSPVYANDGLTLDFIQTDEAFPIHHYRFRVSDAEFDAIFGRIQAAGIPYRSTPPGPVDMKLNADHGGRIVNRSEPDGHAREILTVSYARPQR